jgi:hypothetical protein
MKKYHFVKVGLVNEPTYKGTWYFKPETKEDVDEHWNKYVACEINDGVKEYIDHLKAHAEGTYIGHYTTQWGSLIDTLTAATEKQNIVRIMKEETELYYNRMRDINAGREIYLSEGLTVFMLTEGYTEIREHYYSDTLSFPTEKYTLDDVRYIQWEGGRHWYAKIGKLDIVDKRSNQKWNTKAEAEKAAKEYFQEL